MQKRWFMFVPLLALASALMAVLIISACDAPVSNDFLKGNDVDPNAPTAVTVDQLFTAVQVNSYRQFSGHMARSVSLWMQQMAGTDRQYQQLDQYIITEQDYTTEFSNWYVGSGLIDIRRFIKLAGEQLQDRVYTGYGEFYEAWFMGTCASVFGDVPYSEAVNPEIATPAG
jgi:hypothetical protein